MSFAASELSCSDLRRARCFSLISIEILNLSARMTRIGMFAASVLAVASIKSLQVVPQAAAIRIDDPCPKMVTICIPDYVG